MSEAPSPWSPTLPKLQLVWDATSLNSLMFCPRRYQYELVEGWRGSNVDTEFGGFFATATEEYKKLRVYGESKAVALDKTLESLLLSTWPEGQGPWGGRVEEVWHCLGEEPYKNAKGNKAVCPYAHKGVWMPEPAPHLCGECGSHTETKVMYIPNSTVKNRYTLIRLVVWYIDNQPEDLADGLAPVMLEDGSAAVELSFKMPLPFHATTGEPFLLAGHMDDISTLGSETFIADNKTTTKTLNEKYWQGYEPHTQVDTYDLVGSTLYADKDIQGVVIDAAQVLVNGAHFGRHVFRRTPAQREEYMKELGWWLAQAERFAQDDYWPMNRAVCWLCPFSKVCSKDPSRRAALLEADWHKRHWNPLEER